MSLDRYRAIVADQQRILARLVQAHGTGPVHRVLLDMMNKLVAAVGNLPETFDQTVKAGMLAQVRALMARFVAAGASTLAEGSAAAMTSAANQAFQLLATMEHTFTGAVVPIPLHEIAIMKGVSARSSSLLRVHQRSMARYGARMVLDIEDAASTGLALGENTSRIIDRVQAVIGGEWYQGERIVRTEMAYAYNATHRDAIALEAEAFDGDVWSQWSEQADDEGRPLDDRVCVDSLAMHGQVVPTGQAFVQPPTSPHPDSKGRTQVPSALVGQSWDHPPNRPNDRSTITPWRARWELPGWIWRDGQRVPAGPIARARRAA